MAIKIRCQDCKKKISIDEAFAGGMCRCPYCKALVYVEDAAGGRGKALVGARPAAPTHRPAAPDQAAPARAIAEAGTPTEVEHVPMARPVKIQGIITIVLLVLLVFMIGGAVAMALMYLHGDRDGVPPPPTTQPVTIDVTSRDGASVVDIKIVAPVIYVLDGGSGMRSVFDSARIAVLNSVTSLGNGKFSVVFVGEGRNKVIAPEMAVGGKGAAEKIAPILQEMIPSGAADIGSALKTVLDTEPKTIVLFTRKAVDDPAGLAGRAKAQGTVIHTIVLDGDPEAIESMKKLAEDTGGKTRTFSGASL